MVEHKARRLTRLVLILFPISGLLVAIAGAGLWWTSRPGMRAAAAGVAADGRIHFVGGQRRLLKSADRTHVVYDPRRRVWSYRAPLKVPRMFHAVVSCQGGLYAIGGLNSNSETLGSVEVYDAVADRWRDGPDLPTPRNRLSAVELGGRLYAIGGRDARGDSAVVEAFDPASRRWSRVADLPKPRHGHVSVAFRGRILVLGPTTDVDEYDPGTDSWRSLAPMKSPKPFGGAGVLDGRVYAIGETTEVFDGERWSDRAAMPAGRSRFATAAVEGRIYVLGGEGEHKVIAYDPFSDRWE